MSTVASSICPLLFFSIRLPLFVSVPWPLLLRARPLLAWCREIVGCVLRALLCCFVCFHNISQGIDLKNKKVLSCLLSWHRPPRTAMGPILFDAVPASQTLTDLLRRHAAHQPGSGGHLHELRAHQSRCAQALPHARALHYEPSPPVNHGCIMSSHNVLRTCAPNHKLWSWTLSCAICKVQGTQNALLYIPSGLSLNLRIQTSIPRFHHHFHY